MDNLHNTSEQTLNIQIDTLRDIDEEVFLDTLQDPMQLAGVTQGISRDDTIAVACICNSMLGKGRVSWLKSLGLSHKICNS